jgi:hypothetical protein
MVQGDKNGGERGIRTLGTALKAVHAISSRAPSANSDISPCFLPNTAGLISSASSYQAHCEICVERISWRRGWDSNPRAPLLTGQVDFESTPLRPLRYLSGRLRHPSGMEEILHQLQTLLLHDSRDDLYRVIHSAICGKVVERPCSPPLGVRRAEDQPRYSCMDGRAHAHRARFHCHDKGSTFQPVVPAY